MLNATDSTHALQLRIATQRENFDKHFTQLLAASCQATHPKLGAAVKYATLSGGKRLRPILMALSAEAIGMEPPIPQMQAVELIHCYSLIHDDLPAIDNDMQRRGMPTVHAKFGEDIAILAGDALQSLAWEVATSSSASPENCLAACQLLAKLIGGYGMVGGQAADLYPETSRVDNPQLLGSNDPLYHCQALLSELLPHANWPEINQLMMQARKTGALFCYSAIAPYALSGIAATDQNFRAMWDFGLLFGICYQLQDDLMDQQQDNKLFSANLRQLASKLHQTAKDRLLACKFTSSGLQQFYDLVISDLNNS